VGRARRSLARHRAAGAETGRYPQSSMGGPMDDC
jgi:hypothetical protein